MSDNHKTTRRKIDKKTLSGLTTASLAAAASTARAQEAGGLEVVAARERSDGTFELRLSDGTVVNLPADAVSVVDGSLVISAETAASLGLTGPATVALSAGAGGMGSVGIAGGAGALGAVALGAAAGGARDTESPVFSSGTSESVVENVTGPVHTAAADDEGSPDGVSYALEGNDADHFRIDASTGEVRFASAPDFEVPDDRDGDNTYEITVIATDAAGNAARQDVTITVTDTDDTAPVFSSGATVTVAENAEGPVYTVLTHDPDSPASEVSVSLAGKDAALFDFDPETGEVSFRSAPDFEAPDDRDGDNVYDLVLIATDAAGNVTRQALTITVTDENELPPVVTSAATTAISENSDGTVHTVTASDPDTPTQDLRFSLSGTDAELFRIDPKTGEISFRRAPDFEKPRDQDGDNVYEVTVTASDGMFSDSQDVAITVTDLFDLDKSLASRGFAIQGERPDDQAGWSVSDAGDVNGDGLADMIIGARYGANDAGAAYIVYGGNALANIDLSNLTPAQGVKITGGSVNDAAGWSVSGVGDVNGDGFDDVIVGASYAGDDEGEAHVIYGGASLVDIDLGAIPKDLGFTLTDTRGYRTGWSVSGAGDVNGDGYADFLVSSPANRFGDGSAFVVFGGDDLQDMDLDDFAPGRHVEIRGNSSGDLTGGSVSGIGDINGDGYDDLIVGAPYGSRSAQGAGEAYVIYGSATPTDVDLYALGSNGFMVTGSFRAFAGASVSGVGDVNGDGFDDFVIGSPGVGGYAGQAHLIYGSATSADIDLSALTAGQGATFTGGAPQDFAGMSVSGAGDVNGDGFDDLIVGAREASIGGTNSGAVYVVYGGATLSDLDLASLTAAQGFTVHGGRPEAGAGNAVSGAGDVNGDGFDDILVGAYTNGTGGNDTGAAYVIYGGNTGTESMTPVTGIGSAAADNFTGNAGDDLFHAIGAGDVVRGGAGDDVIQVDSLDFADVDGGNGWDILHLGAATGGASLDLTAARTDIKSFEEIRMDGPNSTLTLDRLSVLGLSDATENAITTLVVHGNSAGSEVIFKDVGWVRQGEVSFDYNLYDSYVNGHARVLVEAGRPVTHPPAPILKMTELDDADGFVIGGVRNGDGAGKSVAMGGDIDGDGFADLLVGAPYGHDRSAGEVYVIYGSASPETQTPPGARGLILRGEHANDYAGYSVSFAGDVNGDGLDDMIIGAPQNGDGGPLSGKVYVVFGGASEPVDLNSLGPDQGFSLINAKGLARTGLSVSSAGDVNQDGFDDLLIGAPYTDPNSGTFEKSFVVYGGADVGHRELSTMNMHQGFKIDGVSGNLGRSVSSAGDVNGDGIDDFIIGARAADGQRGAAYVVFGGNNYLSVDLSNLGSSGFKIGNVGGLKGIGQAVAGAGDVNGDGYDDLIIGSIGTWANDADGAAYIVYGSSSPFNLDLASLTPSQGRTFITPGKSDHLGIAVASAGDVNGDGFDDVLIAASTGGDRYTNEGRVYLIYGGTDEDDLDPSAMTWDQGLILEGGRYGGLAGTSVSGGGDVNGDGFDDIVVGASGFPHSNSLTGSATVIYGGATGTENTVAITRTGLPGRENLMGTAGDDIFEGIGTEDVVRGGAGDDRVGIASLDFTDLDGGNGTDTLAFEGAGMALDITGAGSAIEHFEIVDLTGTGDNSLRLDDLSLFRMSDERAGGVTTFKVLGDAGDIVSADDFADWTAGGQRTEDGVIFDVYTNGNAELLVEDAVTFTT